jgi:pectinesterase
VRETLLGILLMKMICIRHRALPFAVMAALAPAALAAQAGITVRAENPIPAERRDEVIALPWAQLRQALPALAPDRVRVLEAGAELPAQAIDNDGDGSVDELLVLAGFWPGERKDLVVQAQAPAAAPAPRVHARHDDYRDDVAWESDRIAFRIYGQGLWQASEFDPLVSSGVDIWPKRVRDLVVERWYAKGHDEYHRDTGEGADFYTVGPTLGAGGVGVLQDGRVVSAKNFRSHRILATGPIRTVFELTYDPWDAAGVQVQEVRRISIDAGQNLYRMETTFRTADGRDLPFVTGTVKREGLVGATRRGAQWGWLATWGPVERKNGGHGSLGTAVLLPSAAFQDVSEIENHFLAASTARSGVPAVQYTGAGWTASGDFRTVEDWWRYLDAFAERLANPIRVTIGATVAEAFDVRS